MISTTTKPRPRKDAAGDECYTPAAYIRLTRDVLGVIDLDPASCTEAQAVVRAQRYFMIADDGLSKRWRGRVWLNCPYSRPAPWVAKLLTSYDAGDVVESISLFNSRTGSRWFHALADQAWRCEVRRRIRFWGPATVANQTGMNDQVFFYLGQQHERFAAVFAAVGRITPPATSVTQGVTGLRTCSVCRRSLAGLYSNATVCSNRCRQKKHRARGGANPLVLDL